MAYLKENDNGISISEDMVAAVTSKLNLFAQKVKYQYDKFKKSLTKGKCPSFWSFAMKICHSIYLPYQSLCPSQVPPAHLHHQHPTLQTQMFHHNYRHPSPQTQMSHPNFPVLRLKCLSHQHPCLFLWQLDNPYLWKAGK